MGALIRNDGSVVVVADGPNTSEDSAYRHRVPLLARQRLADIEHAVYGASAGGAEQSVRAADLVALLEHVEALETLYELAVGDWCHECGCHESDPCPDGCHWVDADHTLCSACDQIGGGGVGDV